MDAYRPILPCRAYAYVRVHDSRRVGWDWEQRQVAVHCKSAQARLGCWQKARELAVSMMQG